MSRTIGDLDAKWEKNGGNPNCVVCHPDIKEIDISEDDFILLGCDGIFDKLENKDIIKALLYKEINENIHVYAGKCVDNLIKEVLRSKSMDNLTAVLICF